MPKSRYMWHLGHAFMTFGLNIGEGSLHVIKKDEERSKQLLDETPFWVADIFDDVDDVCYTWEKLYKDILNEFTKTRRAKVMTHKHPWIDREIKKLMNKRYKALVQWQKNRTDSRLRKIYQELRNKVNKSLRKAEANYWKDQFANASSSKEFWQIVGKLRKKTKNANIIALKDDDGMLRTLDTEKVEILNDFFADVGENLAKKFGESDRCGNSFINRVTPVCDEIKTNEEKLLHQILSLKPNKAIGDDMISGKELRSGGKSVMPGLKGIFRKSFETGKFPNTWKIAKLRSAFKKGKQIERENYRPLSLLSIPGKILEGQICINLDSHLKINGAQTPKQWGFQEGKSTEYLLLHMTESWKKAIDEGLTVGVLLIDLRKAFDSISHDILKKKFLGCGVSGNMFDMLCDYLHN